MGRGKENIVQEIQCLDKKREIGQLSNDKRNSLMNLKEDLQNRLVRKRLNGGGGLGAYG